MENETGEGGGWVQGIQELLNVGGGSAPFAFWHIALAGARMRTPVRENKVGVVGERNMSAVGGWVGVTGQLFSKAFLTLFQAIYPVPSPSRNSSSSSAAWKGPM